MYTTSCKLMNTLESIDTIQTLITSKTKVECTFTSHIKII